ncbi:MAG: hypothetical protein FJ308_11030 [Planctomycetes bacterium]|nr:hypothetical protein [Planctomycetota bacterium]
MILFAEIVFGRAYAIPYALAAGICLVLLSIWSYRQSALSLPMRACGVLLRAIGIGLMIYCLLEPMGSLERPKPQANAIAVLLDNSASLRALMASDMDNDTSLLHSEFEALISDDARWAQELTKDFRFRRYLFDGGITPTESLQVWTGRGTTSALNRSLQSIEERYKGQSLAGVVLLTDGQSTDRLNAPSSEDGSGKSQNGEQGTGWRGSVPVYPVLLREGTDARDLSIQRVSVQQSEFETAPVTLTAQISHRLLQGQDAIVELLDANGSLVQSVALRLGRSDQPGNATFRFRPDRRGVQGYKVIAKLKNDKAWERVVGAELPKSRSIDDVAFGNNRRFAVVDRGMGPYRILYLSGRPNWEFKFLRRALDEDPELQLTALIRIANKEPKFSFRNTKMDSTNPLFSGFEDVSDEEKEKYNEPVYARLGVKQSGELQKGFPKDASELFEYSAVVLDDLEHEFLTLDQQQMLRQFVVARGGALIVLGGQECMRGKAFRDSVLGQSLPVYGDSSPPEFFTPVGVNESSSTSDGSVNFGLSREGWLQPFMRLSEQESGERRRLARMPRFEVWNRTAQVKPGASVWAEGETSNGETVPLVISHRFGRGRTCAFMVGDFWRWGLRSDDEDQGELFQAWRQLVRGMISDVPRKIDVRHENDAANPRWIRVIAAVVDEEFKSLDTGFVDFEIRSPSGEITKGRGIASLDTPGEYVISLIANESGVYQATAVATSADGNKIGDGETGWVWEPEAREVERLGMDRDTLQRIADHSGGKLLTPGELMGLGGILPKDKIPVKEVRVVSLWHQSWVLVMALICLVLEWFVRRNNGMA